MKVRVAYTYELAGEEYQDLCTYHNGKVSRDTLKQLLEDIGRGGLEEQIRQGNIWRTTEVEG